MIYVGIDIASEKHDCCILSDENRVLSQFTIANDIHGFETLDSALLKFEKRENAEIGLESTGIYGNNLINFLRRRGYKTKTFNPLMVKNSHCSNTLRKTKTDRTDAKHLAYMMYNGGYEPDPHTLYHISEIKQLSRARFRAVKESSEVKNVTNGLITKLFPEIKKFFSDIFGCTSMAVLCEYPSAYHISICKPATLTKILSKASRGRFGADKAKELIELAKNSIGTYSVSDSLELTFCLEKLSLFEKHIKAYEAEIKKRMDELQSPIMTIPGIGYTLGAMIISEIGDISRFEKWSCLLAYAGLDPSVYQSGKYTPESGKMVKRGSPYLRWALITAAPIVARYNIVFNAYMQKKLDERKHYYVAASHTAKKLVRVIFALLSKNVPFSSDFSY